MKIKDITTGTIINNWEIVSDTCYKKTNTGNKVCYVNAKCLTCNIVYEKDIGSILRGKTKQCINCTNPRRFFSKVYIKDDLVIIEVFDNNTNNTYCAYTDIKYFDKLNILGFGISYAKSGKPYFDITSGISKKELKQYRRLHRYICFLEYGIEFIKNKIIDHKDRNTLNNTINNFNSVTELENSQNHSLRKDNTSSISGVGYDKSKDKWYSEISINNKRISLGTFNNFENAKEARLIAEDKYYLYNKNL